MKNSQDIVTVEDFVRNKQDGELRRINKVAEKERRKKKVNLNKNLRKHAIQELRLHDLEEEGDDY